MQQWYVDREAALLAPGGWVNLAGLFWLSQGKNSFGSDNANTLVYHHPAMPATAGYFIRENKQVVWITEKGVDVRSNDSSLHSAVVYQVANQGHGPVLSYLNFRWNIIQRDDKLGVRLRDLASPAIKAFKGIRRYELGEQWKVEARLEKANTSHIQIINVLGQTFTQTSPGKLIFKINGKTYQLDAITEGDELFILFGDATNGKATYAAGRFLYAKMPDENGKTILDFNRAINPPCAFSTYATCPLPPSQNVLPIEVRAGEKNYEASTK